MNRQIQILTMLLQSNLPLTIDSIAEKLNVCNKTVRNDLKHISELIGKKGLRVESKPGIGVLIIGTEEQRLKMMNEIPQTSVPVVAASTEARREYILKRLLLGDKRLTIREIAQDLYLSRASIYKELLPVQTWLKRFNLNLRTKTNQGLEVVGKEKNWRSAVASLLEVKQQSNAGMEEINPTTCPNSNHRIDKRMLKKVRTLIDLDYEKLESALSKVEARLQLHFSDEAFTSFLIHIAIAIKRLEAKKDIRLPESLMNELRLKEEYPLVCDLANELGELFDVIIPESEVGYMLLHILGAKMQNYRIAQLDIDLTAQENDTAVMMAKEIIRISQNALGVNFATDKELLNGLILHLRPTINRLQYGLTLKNPILEQIKENYGELYGAAWLTSVVFERFLGVKANEEEIGYLALHLGAALERARQPLRVLVVCTSGIGTSELIAARLERCFHELEIIDVLSIAALKDRNLSDIDAIISTVQIEAAKPVITVTPLLTQGDIKLLSTFLERFEKRNTVNKPTPIQVEYIPLEHKPLNREQIIKVMCARLEKLDFVCGEFTQDVLNREKACSTAIGDGIAIPHGDAQYAKQAVIAIAHLPKSLDWGGEPVELVILVALPMHNLEITRPYIRNFYRKLCDINFVAQMREGIVVDNLFN